MVPTPLTHIYPCTVYCRQAVRSRSRGTKTTTHLGQLSNNSHLTKWTNILSPTMCTSEIDSTRLYTLYQPSSCCTKDGGRRIGSGRSNQGISLALSVYLSIIVDPNS